MRSSIALDQTTFPLSRTPDRGARLHGIRTGRALSGLAVLFLAFDGFAKALLLAPVVKASHELGFSPSQIFWVGLVLLACLAVHLIPRTALLGAVLLTAFLGGAVAINVRLGQPLFTHVLFPVYVAALVWGGLYLRDGRVRAMLSAAPR